MRFSLVVVLLLSLEQWLFGAAGAHLNTSRALPRLWVSMSPSRTTTDGKMSFYNYGDHLMYLTISHWCREQNLDCNFAPSAPFDWNPTAYLILCGYCYGSVWPNAQKRMQKEAAYIQRFRAQGAKVFVIGPSALGPFNGSAAANAKAAKFFDMFDVVAARDESSYRFARALSPRIRLQLVDDTVFMRQLPTAGLSFPFPDRDRPILGLSLSGKYLRMQGSGTAQVAELLQRLLVNASVVLIPHEDVRPGADLELCRELHRQFPATYLADVPPSAVAEVEVAISRLDLLIAMRYHTTIVAAREAVPFAAFSWAPKYEAFLGRLRLPPQDLLLSLTDLPRTLRRIWALYDRRAEVAEGLRGVVPELKSSAAAFYAALAQKLRAPPAGPAPPRPRLAPPPLPRPPRDAGAAVPLPVPPPPRPSRAPPTAPPAALWRCAPRTIPRVARSRAEGARRAPPWAIRSWRVSRSTTGGGSRRPWRMRLWVWTS